MSNASPTDTDTLPIHVEEGEQNPPLSQTTFATAVRWRRFHHPVVSMWTRRGNRIIRQQMRPMQQLTMMTTMVILTQLLHQSAMSVGPLCTHLALTSTSSHGAQFSLSPSDSTQLDSLCHHLALTLPKQHFPHFDPILPSLCSPMVIVPWGSTFPLTLNLHSIDTYFTHKFH